MSRLTTETEARGHASGKVILLGEHAVVHGEPALAVALDRGVTAVAHRSDGPLVMYADSWQYRASADQDSAPARALRALCGVLGVEPSGATVELDPQIPPRAGLGASAALAVAVARSLASLFDLPLSNETLLAAAHASECVFHGNPSGLDAAVSSSGKTVLFSKSNGAKIIPEAAPSLLIVHSGFPKDTAASVARFAARIKAYPEEASRRMARIGALARRGVEMLQQHNLVTLGALMTENHRHLQWFDISSSALDRIVEIALEAGALGAKLTGGGRGGCAVILLPPNPQPVLAAIRDSEFQAVVS